MGAKAPQPPDGEAENRADLGLLEALQASRADFFRDLCAAAKTVDPDVLIALRQDAAYQFAEFLFVLDAYHMNDVAGILRLAAAHNAYLQELMKDKAKMRRLGLRPDRLKKGSFGPDQLAKLKENFARVPPTIDQSDLARLLTIVMSSETCRKLCVSGEAAGFLVRSKSPYGAMLVRSTGRMERVFGDNLRALRLNLGKLTQAASSLAAGDPS